MIMRTFLFSHCCLQSFPFRSVHCFLDLVGLNRRALIRFQLSGSWDFWLLCTCIGVASQKLNLTLNRYYREPCRNVRLSFLAKKLVDWKSCCNFATRILVKRLRKRKLENSLPPKTKTGLVPVFVIFYKFVKVKSSPFTITTTDSRVL